jgi:hypothetical protein
MTLALATSHSQEFRIRDDHTESEVVTTMNVEVSALLLAVVKHWADLVNGRPAQIVSFGEATKDLAPIQRILKMLHALQSSLKWALEITQLSEHPFTGELLASVLYIMNCAPKGKSANRCLLT